MTNTTAAPSDPAPSPAHTAVLLLFGLLSVTGNVGVVWTRCASASLSSFINDLTACLAVTDLLLTLVIVPQATAFALLDRQEIDSVVCDLLGTLVCFLVCLDVFIIWDIAYMRYLRFCRFETYYRLLYRFYLVVQLGGVSILSIVITSLAMLCTNPDCIVLHRAESMCFSNNPAYLIVLVVLLYFVGIAVLFFLYLQMASAINEAMPPVLLSLVGSFDHRVHSTMSAVYVPDLTNKSLTKWQRKISEGSYIWSDISRRHEERLHEEVVSELNRLPKGSFTESGRACVLTASDTRDTGRTRRLSPLDPCNTRQVRPTSFADRRDAERSRRSPSGIQDARRTQSTPLEPFNLERVPWSLGLRGRTASTLGPQSHTRMAQTSAYPPLQEDLSDDPTSTRDDLTSEELSEELTVDSLEPPVVIKYSFEQEDCEETSQPAPDPQPPNAAPIKRENRKETSALEQNNLSPKAAPVQQLSYSYHDKPPLPILIHHLGDGISRLSSVSPTCRSSGPSFLGGMAPNTHVIDFRTRTLRPRTTTSTSAKVYKEEARVTVTLALVFLSYILPPSLLVIMRLVLWRGQRDSLPEWFHSLDTLAAFTHVMLNPLAYGWTNIRYRRAFLNRVKRRCRRRARSRRLGAVEG